MLKNRLIYKQSLIYLVASVLLVVFSKYFQLLVVKIALFIVYIQYKLAPYFASMGLSWALRKTLILLILPILLAGIPALAYKMIKKNNMPYFIATVWILWLLLVLSDLLIRRG